MTAFSHEEVKRLRSYRRRGIELMPEERMYLHHLDAIKGRYIKFALEVIAIAVLAIISLVVLNTLGDMTRSTHGYGGECLIPLVAFLMYWVVRECERTKK